MAKRKIKIKDLAKENLRANLRLVHPFLREEYRKINEDELNSYEVYTELFGGGKFEPYKLRALYVYQK
jgi:hypothetical protein